ncbi:Uncharacterised protein [uncultured archaeon]|nr:Uncharacterised protein [uncultured archaeon]
MDGFALYKFVEFMIFALYLVFIFLAIQIWLLWKDLNKDDFKLNTFINESFFRKNCIYIFSFTVFFMSHELIEGTRIADAIIYFEMLEMFGIFCLVLFAYDWYIVLRVSAPKKSLPYELTEFTR